MTFQLRHQVWGLAAGLVGFATYAIVIAFRAAGDDVPLTEVAWQHPLLWMLGAGTVAYLAIYGAAWWSTRGTVRSDERDAEIGRYADAAGSGLTAIGALVAMVQLALEVEPFWVVHSLLIASFLGTLASTGISIAAYSEGVES